MTTNKDLIAISWEKPKSNGGSPITGYVIDIRSSTTADYHNAGRVHGDITTFNAENLKEGTKYYLQVSAENKAGLGKPVELSKPVAAKLPYGKCAEP